MTTRLTGFRLFIAAATCAVVAALLSACGGESVVSDLSPSRFIVFGDNMLDVGYHGTRYTVNGDDNLSWPERMASYYGLSITASAAGGTGYAQGNARISKKPDSAGDSSTLTVTEQIEAFLAVDSFGGSDVAVLGGGLSDIVAEYNAYSSGAQTYDAMINEVREIAREHGALTRALVRDQGAQYVLLVGPYDLSRSLWATSIGAQSALNAASRAYNDALLISVSDLGRNVLYVDAEYYFNLVTSEPGDFGMGNSTDVVCTSVDSANGLGIGVGQVNSALCTTSTVVDAEYNNYVFADKLNFTPYTYTWFGRWAFDQLDNRW